MKFGIIICLLINLFSFAFRDICLFETNFFISRRIRDSSLTKEVLRGIGGRIREARQKHGWTQQELASRLTQELWSRNLLGPDSVIEARTINRYENGHILGNPEMIPPLAKVLENDAYKLVYGKFKESLPELSHIGLRIKVARLANGWTQKELADKIGVSQTQIKNWEKGYIVPQERDIEKLAQVFNLQIYLLTDSR